MRCRDLLDHINQPTSGIFQGKPHSLLVTKTPLTDQYGKISGVLSSAIELAPSNQTDCRINLSARELQCAKLLLQGYTAKMMAQQLNISPRAIETYIQNIKKKMKVSSRVDLIRALSSSG